jgi:hypothetical protein
MVTLFPLFPETIMSHDEARYSITRRPGGRETMLQTISRLSMALDEHDARPRRRKKARPAAEFIRAEDVAKIFPLSLRQILQMTVEGDIPGFKVPGCSVWLYREAEVRAKIPALVNGSPQPSSETTSPCRPRSPAKNKARTTTSKSAGARITYDTSSGAKSGENRLAQLMSRRRARSATASSER